ncbi:DNA replication complex GINS family protein [Candidatus Woesearchaeota archaeon]|nr:DNA replication complex GINS family protein [Candidatus Woesearchaeota archaeon]
MGEIKITLETLYDILRNEKKREELQKLEDSFFFDVVNYLKEKKMLLECKKDEDDLFAVGEREKLEYELRSIQRILKEVYEKREKKIIDIALNKSRTKSDIIDTSTMLKEEKDFYNQLIKLLDGYREGILLSLFKGEVPIFQKPQIEMNVTANKIEPAPVETALGETEINPSETEAAPSVAVEKPVMKKIKFIHAVPSFVWKDLKEYGPWEAGEETEIFPEVADLIIEKGRAEEVF